MTGGDSGVTPDPTLDPNPGVLADRDGVTARRSQYDVDADQFADVRAKVEDGLTWGVGAVVTDDRGRVLLVREDGRWLAPGGEVEAGESHDDALVREVREETGIDVLVEDLRAVTDVTFQHESGSVHFYFAHYTATPTSTALTDDPGTRDEAIETVTWAETVPEDTVDREVVVANR